MARISCRISEDPALAARAAAWLSGFHAAVRAEVAGQEVILAADGWTAAELQSVWRSALANERLFEEAAPHRAAVLKALVA